MNKTDTELFEDSFRYIIEYSVCWNYWPGR